MSEHRYTAQELREAAGMDFHVTKLGLDDRPDLTDEIRAMLRQAAEVVERCEMKLAEAEVRSKRLQCDECSVAPAKRGYDDMCSLCDGQCREPKYNLDCLKEDLNYILRG